MQWTLWQTQCGTTSDFRSRTTGGWARSRRTATRARCPPPLASKAAKRSSTLNWFETLDFSNGVELAKALAEEGASVFGWDLEWNMNYNINRLAHRMSQIPLISLSRERQRGTSGNCLSRYRYSGNLCSSLPALSSSQISPLSSFSSTSSSSPSSPSSS